MSKVIEIIDSDDDVAAVTSTVDTDEAMEHNAGVPSMDVAPSSTEHVNQQNQNNKLSMSSNILDNKTHQHSATNQRQRNRRKSVHQTMRASPDMHFETIALDDDDDDDDDASKHNDNGASGKGKTLKIRNKKLVNDEVRIADEDDDDKNADTSKGATSKQSNQYKLKSKSISQTHPHTKVLPPSSSVPSCTAPSSIVNEMDAEHTNVLSPSPTLPSSLVNQMDAELKELLATDEFSLIIRRIAEERVRINFLLASYGMADINFSLNTPPENLQKQFENRLLQRKIQNIKQRSLLNNADKSPTN